MVHSMDKNVCVLIPTYNNERTLGGVLSEVLSLDFPVIVVNDGSTDGTAELLSEFPQAEVISYVPNRGKGYALRTGFHRAFELGYEYAITIDSDGQHEPADIEVIREKLEQSERPTVVMGARNMTQTGVPRKSSFGNSFSNFWFWVNTGYRLSDTQTGFRAYPLKPVFDKRWFSNKFEFEIEVIVRLAWAGVDMQEVPVRVNYPEDRVSHFRPFRDFARISVLNTVFFVLTALYFAPKRLFFTRGKQNIFALAKEELGRHSDSPFKMAASIGWGLFFGIFPIWGFQMAAGFLVGSILKLNRVVILAFSNISIPPFIPLIILICYFLGGFFVSERVGVPSLSEISLETIYLQVNQYLAGAVAFSILLGFAGFGISYLILSLAKTNRR
jgi:glycosyltransferase involved in cell wall biosynthesis